MRLSLRFAGALLCQTHNQQHSQLRLAITFTDAHHLQNLLDRDSALTFVRIMEETENMSASITQLMSQVTHDGEL
jgi:hypothetical protein